jgi:hypothetical protein
MTRAPANTSQQAQLGALVGSSGNPAILVRVATLPRCTVCGESSHFDQITGTHEVVWCAVCNPKPSEDVVPF